MADDANCDTATMKALYTQAAAERDVDDDEEDPPNWGIFLFNRTLLNTPSNEVRSCGED